MRNYLLAGTCVIAVLGGVVRAADAGPMTDGERQRLLAHYEMTEGWLVSELEGLSAAQLTFRSAPDTWTITDIVEHLAIAEPQYWQQVQDSVQKPATSYASETTDAAILWYGIDRSNRQTTGDARVPDGRYGSASKALAAVRSLRQTIRVYAEGSEDDLRGRQLVGGNMDVYQWLLMISTHAERHIQQIREVKAHAGYPGSQTQP